MKFTKMQGAGNDFVILSNLDGSLAEEQYPTLAKTLCRRRISLGADGLMIVLPARNGGDYAMGFYNADGSRGEMCGNGARCIARYGRDRGLAGDTQRIETTAGLVVGERIAEDRYRVRLNDPSVLIPVMPVTAGGREYECTYTELGNPGIPHAVFRMEDWDTRPEEELRTLGGTLRYDPAFPKGANVTFWRTDGGHFKAVTYERGVEDFTLACGTGAGSTAVSLRVLRLAGDGPVTLDFPGGRLEVSLTLRSGSVSDIFLTGPAVTVAEGEVFL